MCLHPLGVAWLPGHGTMVVADMHLERGSASARRGFLLPPYDTDGTLARLEEAVGELRPDHVACLGDSFHDREGAALMDPGSRERLSALMEGREWTWISGNHDPDPPASLPGHAATEMRTGQLTLRHEPFPGLCSGEMAGHLHPGARIVVRGQSLRRKCFAADQDSLRLVLPSFGSASGSMNVLGRPFHERSGPSVPWTVRGSALGLRLGGGQGLQDCRTVSSAGVTAERIGGCRGSNPFPRSSPLIPFAFQGLDASASLRLTRSRCAT